jgi:cAMP phosphodiesterase
MSRQSAAQSDRPDHLLYGHLTPSHLYVELTTFARLLDPAYAPPIACTRPTRRSASPPAPLAGLTVYIMHIKRTPGAVEAIRAEVKAIEAEKGLGCSFVVLEQGMRLCASIGVVDAAASSEH